jgi:predicted protein tyrosine phosphatase
MMRSPTAEDIFKIYPQLEVKSAGIYEEAVIPVNRELIDWADIIFVMEKQQQDLIHRQFKDISAPKNIICLYIADEYDYMDPELVHLLKQRVHPHLNI